MTTKRLVSFDVGIKNLAYCILDIDEKQNITIVEWNVLNLCSPETQQQQQQQQHHTCTDLLKNGKICGKKATYHKNLTCFNCTSHAKQSTRYKMPPKEYSKKSSLKKMKMPELREMYLSTFHKEMTCKKEVGIEELFQTIQETAWNVVEKPEKLNAGKVDLITIGRALHAQLSQNAIMPTVTNVIIENQISPIANRMKTIQGMIAQHYISLGNNSSIEFVSSGNKLKNMEKQSGATTDYQQNKQDGIFYCKKYLEEKKMDSQWIDLLVSSTKKDDLADCFLQAIWWKDQRSAGEKIKEQKTKNK